MTRFHHPQRKAAERAMRTNLGAAFDRDAGPLAEIRGFFAIPGPNSISWYDDEVAEAQANLPRVNYTPGPEAAA